MPNNPVSLRGGRSPRKVLALFQGRGNLRLPTRLREPYTGEAISPPICPLSSHEGTAVTSLIAA